ncbi:DUF4097 family beta strand repeat-containing protein [Spongisporangium articulatum]|uniref:DUF4097 family beta strand repeat-containing protein n=1 Tax=Spongisporangium articulatum TaxID=3362603 RepID=A0ABW8ASZ0_9ACTN
MPTYTTPSPVLASLELGVATVSVTATDAAESTVEVLPSDPGRDGDRRAAEQTTVAFVGGRITVRGPKARGLFGRPGSVEVIIQVPTGSRLSAESQVGPIRTVGRLGECRVRSGSGDIRLEDVGALDALTGNGLVEVRSVTGDATVRSGNGRVQLGPVTGNVVVKTGAGDSQVGDVGGDLRAASGYGDIVAGSVRGSVTASSGFGAVRVGGLSHGHASLKTGKGDIEFGLVAGTAASLDVHTGFGRLRNALDEVSGPDGSDRVVQVQARTGFGDVVVRRA